MNSDVRIKIGLDTGELASGAGRAEQYVSDLTDKIIELRKEGKHTEAFRLELAENGLQGKAARLEQSVKTVASDPRFQTATRP
jgi:hypothetical protein